MWWSRGIRRVGEWTRRSECRWRTECMWRSARRMGSWRGSLNGPAGRKPTTAFASGRTVCCRCRRSRSGRSASWRRAIALGSRRTRRLWTSPGRRGWDAATSPTVRAWCSGTGRRCGRGSRRWRRVSAWRWGPARMPSRGRRREWRGRWEACRGWWKRRRGRRRAGSPSCTPGRGASGWGWAASSTRPSRLRARCWTGARRRFGRSGESRCWKSCSGRAARRERWTGRNGRSPRSTRWGAR